MLNLTMSLNYITSNKGGIYAPAGYVLLRGADGAYLKGADGAYLYGKVS